MKQEQEQYDKQLEAYRQEQMKESQKRVDELEEQYRTHQEEFVQKIYQAVLES